MHGVDRTLHATDILTSALHSVIVNYLYTKFTILCILKKKNWHYAIRSLDIRNIVLTITIEFNVPYFDDSFFFFL